MVSHDAGQGLGQGMTVEEGSVSGLRGSGVDSESPGWKYGDQGERMVSNHLKSQMASGDLGSVRKGLGWP